MAGALALVLSACGGPGPDTPFVGQTTRPAIPPTALEANADVGLSGAYCRPDAHGNYPDDTEIGSSGSLPDHYDYANGGGCLHRPLREAWAVTQNPDVWRWDDSDMDNFDPKPEKTAAFYFEANYSAGPFFEREHWLMGYFHGVADGTVASPRKVILNYQKLKGTKYIRHWLGTIELRALTPNVTSFVMRVQLSAERKNEKDVEQGIAEVLANVRRLPPEWKHLNAR